MWCGVVLLRTGGVPYVAESRAGSLQQYFIIGKLEFDILKCATVTPSMVAHMTVVVAGRKVEIYVVCSRVGLMKNSYVPMS